MSGAVLRCLENGLAALLLSCVVAAGCGTWKSKNQAPAVVVNTAKVPPHVRLTLKDGRQLEVYDAVIQGDSLVGKGPDKGMQTYVSGNREWLRPDRVAVALEDVRTLEVRGTSTGKTIALFSTIALLIAASFAIAVGSGLSSMSY